MGKSSSSELSSFGLPDVKLEKGRYVVVIQYQIPKRILLNGRRKKSPKYEGLYGAVYWLNQQTYNLDYCIFRTDTDEVIKQGKKKIGEKIS